MADVSLVYALPSTPQQYAPDLGPEERNFLPLLAHLRIMLDDDQIGEVIFYHADLTNGITWMSIGFDGAHQRRMAAWIGVAKALNWVFETWEIRMIYIETLEHVARHFRRAERDGIMAEIGRLPGAWWHEDHYEDMVNYVIRREVWSEKRLRYGHRLRAGVS